MVFKNLKPGYPVYMFDRSQVEAREGKVVNVSDPHFMDSKNMGMGTFNAFQTPPSSEMVVDVMIESNGITKSYVFKEGAEVGYNGNLVVASSKELMLQEVEALKNQCRQIISQAPKCKENEEKCDAIITEFNPSVREKEETERRFSKIEKSMSEMKDMLSNFISELKK